MILTKELKIAGAICAAIIGRIMYKNFKKEISENYEAEVEKFVESKMPEEATALVQEYEELETKKKDIYTKEGKEISSRVNNWKKKTGVDKLLSDLVDKSEEELNNYISDNDFNAKKNALRIELGKKVAEYDKENGITKSIESLEKRIDEAKSDYDNKKSMYDVFADEDAAKELKKVAKKRRNRIVESSEKEINELKTKFDEFKKETGKEYSDKIDEIDSKINKKKEEINKRFASQEKDINETIERFRDTTRLAVAKERSEEQRAIISRYEELKPLYSEIKSNRGKLKKEILEGSNFEIKAGVYLHNKGWSKWGVYGVGMIPMSALIFVGVKYLSWLKEFAEFVDKGGVAID